MSVWDGVTVAICSFNGLTNDKLPRNLRALREAGCPESSITLYDVASADGSVAFVEREYPSVRIVRQSENVGPGPSRNQAITGCRTPLLLLLDSDAQLTPEALPAMRRAIESDPRIGVVSPVCLYGEAPDTIQYAGVGLHFLAEATIPWQGRHASERDESDADVGCAPCVALLMRPEAGIRAGLFDVRYFVCKEDGDFIHRVRVTGRRVVEAGAARVLHNCTPRGTNLFHRQLCNGWHLMLKNYQKRTLLLIGPMITLHALLQCAVLVKKGHGRQVLGAMGALLRRLPDLPRDRAAVRAVRAARDADLLSAEPLLVRADVAGGPAKDAYDALCRRYWRVVCALLGGRREAAASRPPAPPGAAR